MEPSKVTSKTSSLKALLLRAWRERWSDLQWGIHIKTILPRGVSGDVYNLADCILQQALVGPGPNLLVLSYLKHSLSSQLVSYAAVLQRISKYDGFHKPHCIISLLRFLENILPGITCRFKPEEEMIAGSVLSLAHWLLQCYHHNLQAGNGESSPDMLMKPANILDHMLKCDFTVAMLYLAKHEHKDLYIEVVNKCQILEAAINQSPTLSATAPIKTVLLKLCSLELTGTGLEVDKGVEPLTYCLQSVLAIQVLLNPSCDSQVLVNQLLMIQRIKGYNNVRLYSELIRACFMILHDVLDTSKESQWGAFTFLKVPHIIHQLHHSNLPRGVKTEEFSQEVVDSLDFVLQFTPLLDTMDARCSCNNLECFLGELLKLNLVSEMTMILGVKTEEFSQEVVDSLDFVLQFTPLLDTMDARCSCNNLECFLGELLKLNLVSEMTMILGVKTEEFSQEVVDSLDFVLQFTPLLDTMDARCSCNNLECFLGELLKLNLVSEMTMILGVKTEEFSQEVVDSLDFVLQFTPLLDTMDARCSCNNLECFLGELLKLNLVSEMTMILGVKTEEFSQEVVDSLDFVLQFTPLLDTMDARCSCNNLECFLGELLKLNLVSEMHVNHYTAKREAAIAELHKMDAASSGMPITKVIIRAEPTLSRVLQSLDAEFPKESLLGMLCQVFTGKSFELILAVATVEGKLCTLVSKLINLNECCKQGIDESNKTLAMLFDITFLMLCYITQTFGSEVVLSDDGKGDSFMKQWVRECLVERGKPKSPDNMLQHCDPNLVEALLTQFTSTDSDFKMNGMTWHEVCFNMPGAIREVLVAWEQEALSVTDVKRILDAMQAPMCCLPVCAATWLCSYMQVSPQDALLKPMNMVQQFLKVLMSEELGKQNNYNERAALMVQIIRKMQFDVHTPTLSKVKAMGLSHSIISKQPLSEQLESVWTSLLKQGWIGIEATHSLESLLNTGGAQWFVTNLVKELVKLRYRDDLDRAVDLLMAVFHLDIENCTLCLLQQVLPQYLHNRLQSEDLIEPQSSALAKLCAYCIFATSISSGSSNSNSLKRSRHHMETDDLEDLCPTSKMLRLDSSSSPEAALMFLTSGSKESPSLPLQEPLSSALKEVFKALSVIAERTAHVSQQTHFVFRLLEYIVRCGKDRARPVLQGMPNTLVPCLVRALPDLFTTDLILRLYDISTKNGRFATARDLCLLRNMKMRNST